VRLASFTVTNFRSITDAYKLPLRDFAVLVGPNNEGKSNILKAIVIALGLLSGSRFFRAQRQVRYRYSGEVERIFDWARDFPISLQESNTEGRSEFVLEFELTDEELVAFRRTTKIKLNSNLRLKLGLGPEEAKFDVLLQGKAKQKLTQNREKVARFIADNLDTQYIPAIRPATLAEEVVSDLVARELARLETDQSYQQLVAQLEEAQQPLLTALSEEITKTVASFIPAGVHPENSANLR
jgi:putative ATP-dependent endonuclease of OLD family